MTDDAQTIFNIPEQNYAKFEKEMAKLSRRSVKLIGEEIKPIVFGYKTEEDDLGVSYKVLEVLITADNPKINGWQFVATLDHSLDTGNIIRAVPNTGVAIPTSYRDVEPQCDHCRVRRSRKDTYLLYSKEKDQFQQVGSSCLQDFFGHDVSRLARLAELLGYADEIARGNESLGELGIYYSYYNLGQFLTHAAFWVRKEGYVSRAKAELECRPPTRQLAFATMTNDPGYRGYAKITEEDEKLADDALEWARGLDRDSPNDYVANICVIAGSEVVEYKSLGIAASILAAYHRHLEREIERKKMATSEHVGEVNRRQSFGLCSVASYATGEGCYGVFHLYRFIDAMGNVLSWFASKHVDLEVGQTVNLTGTVKKHEEYKGVKQTSLSRCKFEPVTG